jgi:hypothetical protein
LTGNGFRIYRLDRSIFSKLSKINKSRGLKEELYCTSHSYNSEKGAVQECHLPLVIGDGVVTKARGSGRDAYDPFCALEKSVATFDEVIEELGNDPKKWIVNADKRIPDLNKRVKGLLEDGYALKNGLVVRV